MRLQDQKIDVSTFSSDVRLFEHLYFVNTFLQFLEVVAPLRVSGGRELAV